MSVADQYRYNVNNFSTTLANSITTASLSMDLTSIASWEYWDEYTATGYSMEDVLTDGDRYTVLTLSNADESVVEVVYAYGPVTGATGIEIERAQDGTTVQNWPSGTKVQGRISTSHLEPGAMFNGYDHYQTFGSVPELADRILMSDDANKQLCAYSVENTLGLAPYFGTISVSGESDVVADESNHGLTLIAGSGITIDTNAGTREITITSSGGGGGDVTGPSSSADNEVVVFDSTTGKIIKRPASAGMIISNGNTAARGSSNYMIRYNTDLATVEFRDGSWSYLLSEPMFGAGSGLLYKNATADYTLKSINSSVLTWLATPSSSNLRAAMTDESGTGALLFQDGALGQPSSGDLANCTNLPIGAGTTGALAETRGGTNQTTYTAGDLLYASASNTLSKRSIGSTGAQLTVESGVPTWKGGLTTFLAYLSSTQTIATSSFVKVLLNAEDFDHGGMFDSTTNNRFTPTIAGRYLIIGSSGFNAIGDQVTTGTLIFKNGSDIVASNLANMSAATTANSVLQACTIVNMNGSTDYLELYTYQNTGGNKDLLTTHTYTFLTGRLVEPS